MNFASVSLPLCFSGQTEQLSGVYSLTQAHKAGGDDLITVFQQFPQIDLPDHHLNVGVLDNYPLEDASEQIPKVVVRK